MSKRAFGHSTAGKMEASEDKNAMVSVESPPLDSSGKNALDDLTVAGYHLAGLRRIFVVLGLLLAGMLFGLDTTIAADVQGSILETFGEIEKLPWVGIGFPMASVSTILLIGQVYALFQVKWVLISFFALFEIGSAVCGAAPTLNALIVGRVIAGLGGAGMYIGALNYIGVFTLPKERPIYHALVGLSWSIGAILGPVIGGAFAVNPHTTWRWAFYINLPIAAAQSPIFFLALPSYQPRPHESRWSKIKTIDWVGVILHASVLTFFLVTLTLSGSKWPWNSGKSIAFWVVFGITTILYAVQQKFAIFTTPERRLFPIQFLKSRTMILLFLVTAASGAVAGIAIYWIPLLFQFTQGDSAIKAAVRLLPYIIPYVVAMLVSGGFLPLIGRYATIYVFGGATILASSAAMLVIHYSTPNAHIYGFEILLGIGAGATYQVAYAVSGVHVGLDGPDLPAAIGFINAAQIGGITIALALAGSIFQNIGFTRLSAVLEELHLPESYLRAALAGAQTDLSVLPVQLRENVVEVLVRTIADLFGLAVAAGGLMLICSVLLKWERMSFDIA